MEPLRKRSREDEERNQRELARADSAFPTNYFGQSPNLTDYIRIPHYQVAQEPEAQGKRCSVKDEFGRVVYDGGCSVNVENTLERSVSKQLYPPHLTNIPQRPDGSYKVWTVDGAVQVIGYGLAEAVVLFPDRNWGRVAYWAYFAPLADNSYRTRYGVLGSCISGIDRNGRPLQSTSGSSSGATSA